eukprot:TRINITY_DN10045_c0_g1_i1.p1 TRINITY_DN10045_c0_g1~~TRINITY_DN10045_c0_g1_i1.p1  ORF type:complete len:212 (+),score=29.82 TRINITY_DN10045_c0_g1_i1:120-755(+)
MVVSDVGRSRDHRHDVVALGTLLTRRCGNLEAAFRTLDVNGEGKLSQETFVRGVERFGYSGDAETIFRIVDRCVDASVCSGFLTLPGFLAAFGMEPVGSLVRPPHADDASSTTSRSFADSSTTTLHPCNGTSDATVGTSSIDIAQSADGGTLPADQIFVVSPLPQVSPVTKSLCSPNVRSGAEAPWDTSEKVRTHATKMLAKGNEEVVCLK